MADGTYVEVEGKFRFGINQGGLDYDDPEQRQVAIDDFNNLLEQFLEEVNNKSYSCIYDITEVQVSPGE